jgi:hypothetical protein
MSKTKANETDQMYRKLCLNQQTELREILTTPGQHSRAIQLFMRQHAMLHSQAMAQTEPWSFEDAIFAGLSEEQVRRLPQKYEHTLAWMVWHITRCEDITMNLLVAGNPQVLLQENWLAKIQAPIQHTGNSMHLAEISAFSNAVDIDMLKSYRMAVGRRTREIVRQLQPEDMKRKVLAARLQRVYDEGAVIEAARGIAEYWGKRDIAGLLLMPATRHHLVHWNEALQLKSKLG